MSFFFLLSVVMMKEMVRAAMGQGMEAYTDKRKDDIERSVYGLVSWRYCGEV